MPEIATTRPGSALDVTSASRLSASRFVMIVGVTAVLFFLGLLPLEAIPEIPVDIDSKPFFIPLVLIALLPAGRPGLAIGLGVALGEFIRDMMEGYELDDPIGFVGYFVAFALTSFMFGRQPPGKLLILLAALSCAFIQAAIEASSFLLFGEESMGIVIQSTLGNTVMHGVVWGAIPAFFLVPRLQGRFEHFLGFETKGRKVERLPLDASPSDFAPREDAVAWVKDLYFYYPSSAAPVLEGVSLDLRPGEVFGLMGRSLSGKSTLCRVLADVAPRATGGTLVGTVELRGRAVDIGYVTDSPAAMMTRTRAIKEVEASLEHLALTRSQAEARALEALAAVGVDPAMARAYIWDLPVHRQLLVALAAAVAEKPRLLILDEVAGALDAGGLDVLHDMIRSVTAAGGAVLLVENEARRLEQWSDRAALIERGRIVEMGATSEVLRAPRVAAELGPIPEHGRKAAKRATGHRADALLTVEALEFAHDDGQRIWQGADLVVRRGEVVGIAGRNGSGKTTLAKLLGGLIPPGSGSIRVGQHELEASPRPDLLAVAMHVPSAFFSERDVRSELAFALRDTPGGATAIAARTAELADLLGIGEFLDTDPGLLPTGPARLAQIAAVLARDAPVLVLDEGSAGMDPLERARLAAVIRHIAERGDGVIVLDHNLDFLDAVSDRILLIDQGKLRDAGPAQSAFAPDRWAGLDALDLVPPSGDHGRSRAKEKEVEG